MPNGSNKHQTQKDKSQSSALDNSTANQKPKNAVLNLFQDTFLGLLLLNLLPIAFFLGVLILTLQPYYVNLIVIAVSAYIVMSIMALWLIPEWQLRKVVKAEGSKTQSDFDRSKDLVKLRDDLRKTLIQVIGGVFVIYGAILALKTFEINRSGQMADRLLNFSDKIRNDDINAREGALTSLKYFCEDSPERSGDVLKLLTDFARDRSQKGNLNEQPQPNSSSNPVQTNGAAANISAQANTANTTVSNAKVSDTSKHIAPQEDVNLAGEIILSRICSNSSSSKELSLNNSNFSKIRYEGSISPNEKNTIFEKAFLENSFFIDSVLSRLSFREAHLSKSNFSGATLTGVRFTDAELIEADFTNSTIRYSLAASNDADFGNADFGNADFHNAKLTGAYFKSANLSSAKNLTLEQLNSVKKLDSCLVPSQFKDELEKLGKLTSAPQPFKTLNY